MGRDDFAGPAHRLADFVEQALEREKLLGVASASVLWMDRELISRDIPQAPTSLGDDALERWLLGQTAFVSVAQARQCVANTPIATSGKTRSAWRPPEYGRAALLKAGRSEPCGLFDVKGLGVAPGVTPIANVYKDGLMGLRCGLLELLFPDLVEAVFVAHGLAWTVARPYALIDLGFQRLLAPPTPAILVVRQAFPRPATLWGPVDPGRAIARRLLDVEIALSNHGMSTNMWKSTFTLARAEGELIATRKDRRLVLKPKVLRKLGALLGDRSELEIWGTNVQFTQGIHERPPRPRFVDFGQISPARAWDRCVYSAASENYDALDGLFEQVPAPLAQRREHVEAMFDALNQLAEEAPSPARIARVLDELRGNAYEVLDLPNPAKAA